REITACIPDLVRLHRKRTARRLPSRYALSNRERCTIWQHRKTKLMIAVVDDDDLARNAIARVLRSWGYGPVLYASGRDFLDLWRASGRFACYLSPNARPEWI